MTALKKRVKSPVSVISVIAPFFFARTAINRPGVGSTGVRVGRREPGLELEWRASGEDWPRVRSRRERW